MIVVRCGRAGHAARRTRVLAATFLLAALAGCAGSHPKGPETGPGTTPAPQPPSQPKASTPQTQPPPPPSNAWKGARSIKVGLVVGANRILVSGSKAWTLHRLRGGEVAHAEGGVPLRISRVEGGALEVSREGEPAPLWSGTPADTLVLESSGHGYAGWSGRWYRGTFLVFASQPNGITLVNDVDMESYLESVLPHEIGTPPESDFEAVKAQAVAARSYTLSYLGRRAALGFDLYASVEDQVYGGIARANEQSR
ncbi:MAG: SpoIID/LytB domain-containing protein, partial [Candidatus Eiseniibacteriota bacterium]